MLALAAALPAIAQNITLKDGTVVVTKGVRRLGDNIMATMDLSGAEPGKPPVTGEFGYPIPKIAKIDFPEPGQLKLATELINAGRAREALAQLQPVLAYYDGFADAPGSWWADATVLKEQALLSLGRNDEAENLAEQMARMATDPDIIGIAKVYMAAEMGRRGENTGALEIYDAVLKNATRPQTLAVAAVYKGKSELALKDWEPALLSLLEVPVFYPEQEVLMPEVLLGSAQAYIGLRDFTRAAGALNELSSRFPSTPEAAQGTAEAQRMAKLKKSIEPLK